MIFKNSNFNNRYIKYIASLSSGTVIAQSITFFFSPIITRLYSAQEYGNLSLFASLVVFLSIFGNLSYHYAIILPKKKSEAESLFLLTFYINLAFSLLLLFVILLLMKVNSHFPSFPKPLLVLLPLGVFSNNLSYLFTYWLNRLEAYHQISFSKVLQTSSVGLSQVFLTAYSGIGLQLGYIIGRILSATSQFFMRRAAFPLFFNKLKFKEIKASAIKYINHPKYIFLSDVLSIGGIEIPVLLISLFYSADLVGFYGLSHKILSIPTAFLGLAVDQVFFQRLSDKISQNKPVLHLLKKTWFYLFIIGVIPFLLIFLFGSSLFSWVFGANWGEAGRIASVLSPLLLLQYISGATGKSLIALQKQKYQSLFSLCIFLSRAGGIMFGVWQGSFYAGLIALVILNAISLIGYDVFIFYMIRNYEKTITKDS